MLTPYEGTKADDDGTAIWYPDFDERERYKMEFYTCMKKAVSESPQDMEHALVLLAGYCQKAGLEEEACTVRAAWNHRFKPLGEDLIRKIFRETYVQPYNGKVLSQMNEKERIIREHNQSYMEESSTEGVLPSLFEPVPEHTKENLWRGLIFSH